MKFLTDENVSPKVVRALREKGHNVFDIKEEGLQGVSDDEIMKRARSIKHIIVSEDLDFGNLRRFPLIKHPGAILMHFQNMKPRLVAGHVLSFIKNKNPQKLEGCIFLLEEGRVVTIEF